MKNTRPATTRWWKLLRILFYTLCTLLVLAVGAIYALTLPAVQQRLTREAQTFLQGKLGTRVEVGAVRVRFPFYLSLENFLLEDQQGDTLARVGNLVVSIDMWKLLNKTIEFQKVTLEDASIYLHQKDSINNLSSDSEVITFQIRAITRKRLKGKLGEVTEDQLRAIRQGLDEVLTY